MSDVALRRELSSVAWLFALLAGLMLYASLRGSGTGVFGSGVLRHEVWSWVVVIALVALAVALAYASRASDRVTPDAPRSGLLAKEVFR